MNERVKIRVGSYDPAITNLRVSSRGASVERALGQGYSTIEVGLSKPYRELSGTERGYVQEAVRIARAVTEGRGSFLTLDSSLISHEEARELVSKQDIAGYVNRVVDIPNINKRVRRAA